MCLGAPPETSKEPVVPWAVAARFEGKGSVLFAREGPHRMSSVVLCGLAKSSGSLGVSLSSGLLHTSVIC